MVTEGRGRRAIPIAAGVLVLVAAGLLIRLGAQDRGGPAHADLSAGDGVPITLYVPEDEGERDLPYQEPVGQRPPVIVVAHGYSADRLTMSSMARSLARAGYAVVTFDFRGHGANTDDFRGELRDDFATVVDWVETSPHVDGDRVAVLGHSMGAGAALDFATIDPRPDAVVPVSGGWFFNDEEVPEHVLFVVAERDPDRIHDNQRNLANDLGAITDVRSVEIDGTDHGTILWSGDAIREIVAFLDPVLGVERAEGERVGLRDPRLGTAGLYLLVVLALIAFLGLAAGRLVEPAPSTATPGALLLLAGALLLTTPLLATGGPGFLPLGATQPIAVHLAMAGGVLWAARSFAARRAVSATVSRWLGDGPWLPLRSVAAPGVATGLAIFLLLAPLGAVGRRFVPTTERALLWVVVALLILPFFAAFEALVRRGSTRAAIGWGALGRVILLVVIGLGLALEVLPFVISLSLPLLVLQYVVLELFAATCYASGRNPALIAVVESVFIGWLVTTVTPIG